MFEPQLVSQFFILPFLLSQNNEALYTFIIIIDDLILLLLHNFEVGHDVKIDSIRYFSYNSPDLVMVDWVVWLCDFWSVGHMKQRQHPRPSFRFKRAHMLFSITFVHKTDILFYFLFLERRQQLLYRLIYSGVILI